MDLLLAGLNLGLPLLAFRVEGRFVSVELFQFAEPSSHLSLLFLMLCTPLFLLLLELLSLFVELSAGLLEDFFPAFMLGATFRFPSFSLGSCLFEACRFLVTLGLELSLRGRELLALLPLLRLELSLRLISFSESCHALLFEVCLSLPKQRFLSLSALTTFGFPGLSLGRQLVTRRLQLI